MNATLEQHAMELMRLRRAKEAREAEHDNAQVWALTVRQPDAWLIANGERWPFDLEPKTVICLPWRTEGAERFGRVAIHVSTTFRRAEVEEQLRDLHERGLIGGRCPAPQLDELERECGHVIGVGRLVRIEHTGATPRSPWAAPNMWGWTFDALRLVRPVPVRSSASRGLWALPPATVITPPASAEYVLRSGSQRKVVQRPNQIWTVVRAWGLKPHEQIELNGEIVVVAEALARAADDFAELASDEAAREEARGIARYWRTRGGCSK